MASIAGARPIARGSRNSPPAAAMRLCRTSASPNAERVVATTTSAASTISMTARGRESVDRDHDRLLALAVHEAAEAAALGVERRRGAGLPDDLEVGARAEDGARLVVGVGGEHADPDVGIVLEAVDRRLEASAISRSTALRASGRFSVMTPIRSDDEYRTADTAGLPCRGASPNVE